MKPCSNQLSCDVKCESSTPLFTSTIHDREYEFRRCDHCGLIFHVPQPTKEELADHYTDYGCYSDHDYFAEQLQARRKVYARRAKHLFRYMPSGIKPKLLEVGCSSGILLRCFGECGYDCYGVEVDASSSALAEKMMGADRIHTGELATSRFLDESFDVVVCDQTIEHVPNPFELLLQINRALRQNGILYIATPNFAGPSFLMLKDRWKNTLPGDHISMFTFPVLRMFLQEAGFVVLRKKIGGFGYNARRGKNGAYQRHAAPLLRAVFLLAGVGLTLLSRGDRIAVVCRKDRNMASCWWAQEPG